MKQATAVAVWFQAILVIAACSSGQYASVSAQHTQQAHTSNWAVLVATSKYWYNYRHIANTLSFYRTVKRLGIPDSNIILMLAEDVACNPRNSYPSQVFNDESHRLNVYGTNVEVDYRGYEVTVENFIRVLTGRHDPAVPRPKRMLSDKGSNVLIYISGHGGNEFMKFQDVQELMAQDVADAIQQMYEKGRYRELLLVVETCQAATLYSRINSPNVLSMASSLKGESSYSYRTDMDVGLSLIDRFTWQTLDFFEKVDIHSNMTLTDLVRIYSNMPLSLADLMRIVRFDVLDSHFDYDASHYPRRLDEVPVTSFFGSVSSIKATPALGSTAGELAALQDDIQQQSQHQVGHHSSHDRTTAAAYSLCGAATAGYVHAAETAAVIPHVPAQIGPAAPSRIADASVYLGMTALASLIVLSSLLVKKISPAVARL